MSKQTIDVLFLLSPSAVTIIRLIYRNRFLIRYDIPNVIIHFFVMKLESARKDDRKSFAFVMDLSINIIAKDSYLIVRGSSQMLELLMEKQKPAAR